MHLTATGLVEIELSRNGSIVNKIVVPNLVVATGKEYLARKAIGDTVPTMSHMAIGTVNTASNNEQTALESELARVTFDTPYPSYTNNIMSFVATFGQGVATTISGQFLNEVGLFNDATSGIMLARTVFPSLAKGAADSLSIRWNITIN